VRREMPSTQTLYEAAREYGECGIPVFPVHSPRSGGCTCGDVDCRSPGKHPRTAHGWKDGTTDPAAIQDSWRRWPDANIAIVTGSPSGLLAVDVDPRHGGDASLALLQARFGPLPETVVQESGGGGLHFFFRVPTWGVPAALGPGIDLKCHGGYILGAPSRHISGRRYRFRGEGAVRRLRDVPAAPDWILQAAQAFKESRRKGSDLSQRWGEGERNSRLASFAGKLRSQGLAADESRPRSYNRISWRAIRRWVQMRYEKSHGVLRGIRFSSLREPNW
jgi:hypothetical protein